MFIVTPRLLLRPGWPEDAQSLYAAIADEDIIRNLSSAPWPYQLADAEQFLASSRPAREPNFLIFRRTHGAPKLVGAIGFGAITDGGEQSSLNGRMTDPRDQVLELGYWISREHWGLGYATEAGQAVLQIAESLGHRHLIAEHFVDNPASGHVLQKLGFQATGNNGLRYSKGRGQQIAVVGYAIQLGKHIGGGDLGGDDGRRNRRSTGSSDCDTADADIEAMRPLAA